MRKYFGLPILCLGLLCADAHALGTPTVAQIFPSQLGAFPGTPISFYGLIGMNASPFGPVRGGTARFYDSVNGGKAVLLGSVTIQPDPSGEAKLLNVDLGLGFHSVYIRYVGNELYQDCVSTAVLITIANPP